MFLIIIGLFKTVELDFKHIHKFLFKIESTCANYLLKVDKPKHFTDNLIKSQNSIGIFKTILLFSVMIE